jgi:hypothetical protein
MKLIAMPPKTDGWKSVKTELPAEKRELYIVVQLVDGEQVRSAAWFEQDANGAWGFNKPEVTHWTEWPKMPSA